jgi:hypothetical protein
MKSTKDFGIAGCGRAPHHADITAFVGVGKPLQSGMPGLDGRMNKVSPLTMRIAMPAKLQITPMLASQHNLLPAYFRFKSRGITAFPPRIHRFSGVSIGHTQCVRYDSNHINPEL